MTTAADDRKPLGVYLHVPFCAQVCHYCDFAKTARHDEAGRAAYMRSLADHAGQWLAALGFGPGRRAPYRLVSVFLGGGTPSLFTDAWGPVLARVLPHAEADAEVSLEANPEHVDRASARLWRSLGVNRLSLGVQTLQAEGLRVLTRGHSRDQALAAIDAALAEVGNVNVDFIYSWPGATPDHWRDDLAQAVRRGVPHLSLYNLTYAEGTVLGRREKRGLLVPPPDEAQADAYELARQSLAAAGYAHEEVSNWCLPGHACRHNWLYWQDGHYLGVGSGAHGYLDDGSAWGIRYAYGASPRPLAPLPEAGSAEIRSLAAAAGATVDEGRDAESWLLEFIGAGLRSALGIDWRKAQKVSGRRFKPRPAVAEAMARGVIRQGEDGRLTLRADEWFRETSWATEVALSFVEDGAKL